MSARTGSVSLGELMIVFWGFLLVLAALAEFAHGQGRLARRQEALVRLREAQRTTGIVLGAELRALSASDVRLEGPHALELRATRGGGPVCFAADDRLEVLYRGARRPDPAKDSVIVVGPDGEEVRDLAGAEETGCGSDGVTLRLDGPPAVAPLYVLVFEPGSYHLVNGAVRYRIGAAGRQPLTESVFSAAAFGRSADGALRVRLELEPDSLRIDAAEPVSLRLHSLNPLPL